VYVDLQVSAFSLELRDGTAVELFEHPATRQVFPLWLDDPDAAAIAKALGGGLVPLSSQGLFVRALRALGARIEHAALVAVTNGVVDARLTLRYGDETVELDATPSDAGAAAFEAGPLVVEDSLREQVEARVQREEAKGLPGPGRAETLSQAQAERWNQLLSHLSSGPQGPPFEA
jgi:bifunctional DNase/RNase